LKSRTGKRLFADAVYVSTEPSGKVRVITSNYVTSISFHINSAISVAIYY